MLQHVGDGVAQAQEPAELDVLGWGHGQVLVGPAGGAAGEPGPGVGEVAHEPVHLPAGQRGGAPLVGGQRPGGVCEAVSAGGGGHRGDGHLEGGRDGSGRGDGQVGAVVATGVGPEGAQDLLGVVGEVPVDADSGVADLNRGGHLEVRLRTGLGAVAAPQDQQVGHHLGARGAMVGAGGQAHRAQQHGLLGDGPTCCGVLGVEGVSAGEHRDGAPGLGQRQRLEDEVVVHGVPALVMHRVGQAHVGERDVADDAVEGPRREGGVGEGLREDLGLRVEVRCDRGGGRVQLDPGHHRPGRGQAQEGARPTARLEHAATGEPQLAQPRPHRGHVGGVGVVGVDGRPRRGVPLPVAEQCPQLRSLLGVEQV